MADEECKCYGKNINISLDTLIGVMTQMNAELTDIKQYSFSFLESVITIRKILEHYHNSHCHEYPHDGQEKYDVPMGGRFLPSPITPIDHLVHEYQANYDTDGNGMIYGTDFKIIQDSCPNAIREINKLIKDSLPKMSLDQYVATVPSHDKLWLF